MRYTTRRFYNEGRCQVPARVAGIPCLVRVDRYQEVPDTHTEQGWRDLEYQVCDRKGYPAPWLERKLTYKARLELERHLVEQIR